MDWQKGKERMKRILALLICLMLPLLSGCDRGLDYEMLGDNWVPDLAGDARIAALQLTVRENLVRQMRIAVESSETVSYEAYVGFSVEEGEPQQAEALLTVGDLYWLIESAHAWLSEHDKAHFESYALELVQPSAALAGLEGFFAEGEGVAEYSIAEGSMDRVKSYEGDLPYGALVATGEADGAMSWVFLISA